MYKITVDGKTMVGCNEDAWRTSSRIWFENAKVENEYGVAFTGSRQVGPDKFALQSGMNEAGLVFSRLASYHPEIFNAHSGKKKIDNEVSYLSSIMHTCATVDEVAEFVSQYDHSIFIDDVFIYIDSFGRYLVVEPYHLIHGNDSNYVLSNFCPSITEQESARKLDRYRAGEDFLKMHDSEASLSYCTALSDTMHVCRDRNGDGTLLTSIWDVEEGLVHLFFYHSFDTSVQFNISEELSKGDHMVDIVELFPANREFERLANYITPFNTPSIRVLLAGLGALLSLLALVYGLVFLIKRSGENASFLLLGFSGLNLILTFYYFVLATHINIFYFNAPYRHYSSDLFTLSSFTPFILLIGTILLIPYTVKIIRKKWGIAWTRSLLAGNAFIYVMSLVGFAYWGLFNFWN